MRKKLFLKPSIGLAVWLPARGRNVFPEGEMVSVDSFVARCIAEGSLVEVTHGQKNRPKETNKTIKHKGDK